MPTSGPAQATLRTRPTPALESEATTEISQDPLSATASIIFIRQQITAVITKAESYNNFSDWLFFGGEGVIQDHDPEEHEKRLKFNQRLANSLILQIAMDVTEILRSLAHEGYSVKREDVATLSPYLTSHVKRFGDYVVDLDAIPAPLDGEMPELTE